jgi:hypothetical protein
MRFTDWHPRLFRAIALEDGKGTQSIDAGELALRIGAIPRTGWVGKAVDLYERKGFLQVEYTLGLGPDRGHFVTLTAEGLEAAEAIGQPFDDGTLFDDGTGWSDDLSEDEPTIPAADRFVSRSDNQIAFDQVVSALDGVAEAVRTTRPNSLFASDEERLYVASELEGIASAMSHGVARVATLMAAIAPAGGVLIWLAKEAAGGVIGDAASAAAKAIAVLLGLA